MYVVQSVFRAGTNLQLPFLLPGHEDYEKGCRNVIISSSNNITIIIIPVPLSLDISAQPRTAGSLEGRRLRDVTRGKLALSRVGRRVQGLQFGVHIQAFRMVRNLKVQAQSVYKHHTPC